MLEERVRGILENLLGADMHSLTPATTLRRELGLDWGELVDIVCALEVEFEVAVPDVANLATFGDLCAAVSGTTFAA